MPLVTVEGAGATTTRGWKSEKRSTKNCTPCRWPRLNINYRPCSTVNASLFVEIRSWEEEARYNKRDTIIAGSFRDIKKRGGGENRSRRGFVKGGKNGANEHRVKEI